MSLVLDASLTMAWCFESEANQYTEGILARMEQGEEAVVPTLWRLEVVNALLKAKRRGRVTAERAVLAELGGGCQVPLGAHATLAGGILTILAKVISPTSSAAFEGTVVGPQSKAAQLGQQLGKQLLEAGAAAILREVYGH